MPLPRNRHPFDHFPPSLAAIIGIAFVAAIYILLRDEEPPDGQVMWTFIADRVPVYEAVVSEWELPEKDRVAFQVFDFASLYQRAMSGFFSGTPLPDMIEIGQNAAQTWRGPLDAVGFHDLTEAMKRDQLFSVIHPPALTMWTHRGHIFGLPADVHPVLLAYRADVFEAAGIDVSRLDTWDAFFAATAQLVIDKDGDGTPDQYVFEFDENGPLVASMLIRQAGGGYFNADGYPILDCKENIHVLARLADWATGADKVTGDLNLMSAAGNRLRAEGYVLSWAMPDWRSKTIETYIPSLSGKLKVMPLPAWQPGGRRTSTWGGTMLGFPKSSSHFARNWEFAKRLYLSAELMRRSWREFRVITPVAALWDDPVFDEPVPFFGNQPLGRMFIGQTHDIPYRTSSPYFELATIEFGVAVSRLTRLARDHAIEDIHELEAQARLLLQRAQRRVLQQMNRNRFQMDLLRAEQLPDT
jgi:arabinosaccharide transport system substrate-binding protein